MIITILGRQPAIGLAELEALYGADNVRAVENTAALVDADINFKRLGGSQKAGQVLTTIHGSEPKQAFLWLQKNLADHVGTVEGKLKLGVSLYGVSMAVNKLGANVLTLKRILRDNGQSVRVIPNTEPDLSSAQTYHNNLTDERGCEIMIVRDGGSMIIARATDVQGIDAYRKRDQERPHRDTFVGMLPPKLAQTIVNLAAGSDSAFAGFALPAKRDKINEQLASSEPAKTETEPAITPVLLDPFCGTGVILQEAALMGYEVYGTDLEEKMVRYSRDNLSWLFERYPIKTGVFYETADATDHTWRKPINIVACEGYLGHPFATEPNQEALTQTIQTCNLIMRKFLKNIGTQLESGTRLCIAAPAWHATGTVHHLPIFDTLEELGYTRIAFKHVTNSELIYHRTDQVVGRELVVLVKN